MVWLLFLFNWHFHWNFVCLGKRAHLQFFFWIEYTSDHHSNFFHALCQNSRCKWLENKLSALVFNSYRVHDEVNSKWVNTPFCAYTHRTTKRCKTSKWTYNKMKTKGHKWLLHSIRGFSKCFWRTEKKLPLLFIFNGCVFCLFAMDNNKSVPM